ncbi:ABC transporter permease subunit [Synechococcales cyanobacterium C]|uniref:ABC transporter permease subunit n=1 Tax=Petrachloros mirabilis ULC683 TaxID=2781853 RepID=A0A8K1ZXN1_9CYAN|nr:ABC transporter permease [Petrachloros mirabilis]NCJ06783.1 ABC transporter permease subunit [Petrachloros mirabilis ULC683]
MNVRRIWSIAANVFREIFRERVLYLAGLYAIALVLSVLFLTEVSGGAEAKISLDVGMAGMGLFGLAVAAFVGGGLINKEIEKRTALVLIAKPMSRSEFILGKHLGLSAVLAVLLALMMIIFLLVMSWRQIDYPLGSLLISTLYLGIELSLITAAAILFGVFTSSLIATILTFAVYVMGHFSQNLVALSQSIETESVKTLVKGIYLVFPDLARLDLKNQAVYGILPNSSELLVSALYGIAYIVLLLTVSTLIFARREF